MPKIDISTRAMLISLSVTGWSGRKLDRTITKQVSDQHGTAADAGRYNKAIIQPARLKPLQEAENGARAFHYANTLPWLDTGARILCAQNFEPYMHAVRAFKADYVRLADSFCDWYGAHGLDEEKRRLNGMFREDDYPSAEQVRRKFTFDVTVSPLPDATDFRVELSGDEVAAIRAEIGARATTAASQAMGDVWTRLHDTVAHMAERLGKYKPAAEGTKAESPFRDSMVTNLRELVDLLPRLNLTDDAKLEAMRQRLANELCHVEPDALRTSDALRQTAARTAEDILRDMQGYLGAAA